MFCISGPKFVIRLPEDPSKWARPLDTPMTPSGIFLAKRIQTARHAPIVNVTFPHLSDQLKV